MTDDSPVAIALSALPPGPIAASIPATIPAGTPAVLPTATERLSVAFAGDGSGTGELSWGQLEIWSAMTRQGWIRLGGVIPLSPGTTVQDVADELGYMMSRYQSMRTRLRFEESGRPTQELFASGEINVEVYDADDETGPRVLAAAVEARYLTMARDFVHEWPVRMGVVRHRGVLTHLVVISCHLVTDGAGMLVLAREVAARETAPVSGMQHLELSQWQRSPAGERQSAATLRRFETVLRSVVPRPLRESSDRREPRHWTGELNSPALRLAVQAISERTRADATSVLMALYAVALGRKELLNPAVLRPLVSNRFRPGLADVVCNLVQSGVCVLDVVGLTVDEAVAQAQRASRTVFKHAYFDPEGEFALIDRIAKEEEGPNAVSWGIDTWSFFNDLRTIQSPLPNAAEAGPDRMEELLAATSFSWAEKKDNPFEPLFLTIADAPESMLVIVRADTHYISPADNEGLAREMETVAVEAFLDPAAPTRVETPVGASHVGEDLARAH